MHADDQDLGPDHGAIAEFNALRQEIVTRVPLQHQVFVLQLTTTGAVFGLVLSEWSLVPILFILPITSYLFAASHYDTHRVITQIAAYINTQLDGKVPGGLGWESWVRKDNEGVHKFEFVHPFLLAFPGPSVLALGVVAPYTFGSDESGFVYWSFVSAWVAGIVLAVASLRLAWKLAKPATTPPEKESGGQKDDDAR